MKGMANDVFGNLAEYHASVAQERSSKARQAKLLAQPTATGTEREDVYREFLERHLPRTCDVFLGGYVFDMLGRSSSQMDVIVTGGNIPRFKMSSGNRYIAPLEGTIGVAEIKSHLTKQTLYEALEGCASIPTMPEPKGIVAPMLRLDEADWNDTPYKIVFAYDGITADTVCAHIAEFYERNSDIPMFRRPDIVHVLNKYMILRIASGIQVTNLDGTDSDQPEMGQFYPFTVASDFSALVLTLTILQKKAFLSFHSLYKFDGWHDNIVGRITGSPRFRVE